MLDGCTANYDHMDPVACRRMWCAVLAEMWRLATTRPRFKDRWHHVEEARDWFRTEHCKFVCELAGFEHDKVVAALRRAVAIGAELSPWQKGKVAA